MWKRVNRQRNISPIWGKTLYESSCIDIKGCWVPSTTFHIRHFGLQFGPATNPKRQYLKSWETQTVRTWVGDETQQSINLQLTLPLTYLYDIHKIPFHPFTSMKLLCYSGGCSPPDKKGTHLSPWGNQKSLISRYKSLKCIHHFYFFFAFSLSPKFIKIPALFKTCSPVWALTVYQHPCSSRLCVSPPASLSSLQTSAFLPFFFFLFVPVSSRIHKPICNNKKHAIQQNKLMQITHSKQQYIIL